MWFLPNITNQIDACAPSTSLLKLISRPLEDSCGHRISGSQGFWHTSRLDQADMLRSCSTVGSVGNCLMYVMSRVILQDKGLVSNIANASRVMPRTSLHARIGPWGSLLGFPWVLLCGAFLVVFCSLGASCGLPGRPGLQSA